MSDYLELIRQDARLISVEQSALVIRRRPANAVTIVDF